MLRIVEMNPSFHIRLIKESEEEARARKDYGDIETFADNLANLGLIKPITIEHGTNRLLAGGRRLAAFKHLERKSIPAILVSLSGPIDAYEVELFENRHRKDMTWHEETALDAKIHAHYMSHELDWNQTKTAKHLGISKGEMTKRLQLATYLDVVPELKDYESASQAVTAIERVVADRIAKNDTNKLLSEAINDKTAETETVSTGNTELPEEKTEDAPPKDDPMEIQVFGPYQNLLPKAYIVGDALERLPKVKPESFHGAEVDPPYGIDLHEKRNQVKDKHSLSAYNEVDAEGYVDFLRAIAEGTYNALKEDTFCIWWFGVQWYTEVRAALIDVGFKVPDVPGIWVKEKGQTNNPRVHLASMYETFFLARKGSPKLAIMGKGNVFPMNTVPQAERRHPTQRPVELLKILMGITFPRHASILVPFLGSGATLIAAYQTERWGLGWDLEERNRDHFYATVAKMQEEK